jgi:hypothetical protein
MPLNVRIPGPGKPGKKVRESIVPHADGSMSVIPEGAAPPTQLTERNAVGMIKTENQIAHEQRVRRFNQKFRQAGHEKAKAKSDPDLASVETIDAAIEAIRYRLWDSSEMLSSERDNAVLRLRFLEDARARRVAV